MTDDEMVLARTLMAGIDKVSEALDELSLLCYDPATKIYANEDLADYISNIRSMMSFSTMMVQHAKAVRVEQHGAY